MARISRYSAKMVSHLADGLLSSPSLGSDALVVDPFCGSGEILLAAQRRGVGFVGIDVNPYAVLLARVQTQGFNPDQALNLAAELFTQAKRINHREIEHLPLENSAYWFTPSTLNKLNQLRFMAQQMHLSRSASGRAVLLAITQAVRIVSRADNRSPKPFISKTAILQKHGVHRDPYYFSAQLLDCLCEVESRHERKRGGSGSIVWGDTTCESVWQKQTKRFTHLITSPPYINAQDYYRNFKFEIAFLEKVVSFSADAIKRRFIGRERGLLADAHLELGATTVELLDQLHESLPRFRTTNPKEGAIVYRYFHDMAKVFKQAVRRLQSDPEIQIVCADSEVKGFRLPTGTILCNILSSSGFEVVDMWSDPIRSRAVPPKRAGHTGVMKSETVYSLRRTTASSL